jgi:hypothetical protein
MEITTTSPYFEYKYVLPLSSLRETRTALNHYLISPTFFRASRVTSIYYDTRELDEYFSTLSGDSRRQKIRYRLLSGANRDEETARFECKDKANNKVSKLRLTDLCHDRHVTDPLMDIQKSSERSAHKFIAHSRNPIHLLSRQVEIKYDRERYICPTNNIRVNLDSNLSSIALGKNNFSGPQTIVAPYCIVELKSSEAPTIPFFLNLLSLKRVGFSKYSYFLSRHLNDLNYRLEL